MKRVIRVSLVILLCMGQSLMGQNLLNLSGWTIGEGSTTGFSKNGSTSENTREWGIGPQGNRVIIWKASPDGNNDGDGGWNYDYITVDNSKMYRFSVWIKKSNSNNGTTYFGPRSQGGNLSYATTGNSTGNPYFFSSDLPQLDNWYLLVSFVQGSGDNNSTDLGKMYDGITGEVVRTLKSFKFDPNTTHLLHRAYLYYDTNTSDLQYFYAPRIDEVNGNEPSIAELLGLMPNQLGELSVGTDNLPSGYKLSVGGDAIMEKVKVQAEGSWPDYVFEPDYNLLSISELQEYIREKGHLPGVPSAKEVKNSNQDLGSIQLKLLEKIEELTLYTIEQQKEIDSKNSAIDQLRADFDKLQSQYLAILELLKNKDN